MVRGRTKQTYHIDIVEEVFDFATERTWWEGCGWFLIRNGGVSYSDSSNHVTLHNHIFVNKKYLKPKTLLSEHSHGGRNFSPLQRIIFLMQILHMPLQFLQCFFLLLRLCICLQLRHVQKIGKLLRFHIRFRGLIRFHICIWVLERVDGKERWIGKMRRGKNDNREGWRISFEEEEERRMNDKGWDNHICIKREGLMERCSLRLCYQGFSFSNVRRQWNALLGIRELTMEMWDSNFKFLGKVNQKSSKMSSHFNLMHKHNPRNFKFQILKTESWGKIWNLKFQIFAAK